jgi:isopenicillin-N epimerase
MQRRTFLRAATGLAALKADSINRARAAASSINDRTAEQAARDEDFWREIQQAFTVDRNIINLNNGGVCPSPKVVQDAMRRQLEFSNMAPAYTMWTVLEPEIESVRARLAASFGCDPEEMAITRNASEALEIAQLGMDLKPSDEVLRAAAGSRPSSMAPTPTRSFPTRTKISIATTTAPACTNGCWRRTARAFSMCVNRRSRSCGP